MQDATGDLRLSEFAVPWLCSVHCSAAAALGAKQFVVPTWWIQGSRGLAAQER